MDNQVYFEHTVNPTDLIGCGDWTPVQPCPSDNF